MNRCSQTILMLLATLTLPEPTRYAFAPSVSKEQAGRPSFKPLNVFWISIVIVRVALRGHPTVVSVDSRLLASFRQI